MTGAQRWLDNALQELTGLLREGDLEGPRAWRTLALGARVRFAPTTLDMPEEWARLGVEALADSMVSPSVEELVEPLAEYLVGVGDAYDQLLDQLLDIDDALGVWSLLGQEMAVARLLKQSRTHIEARRVRVAELAGFACLRLATMAEHAPGYGLWSVIAHMSDVEQSIEVPNEPFLAAADAATTERYELRAEDGEAAGVCIARPQGGLQFTLALPVEAALSEVSPVVTLVVEDRVTGERLAARTLVDVARRGNDVYVELGPVHGADSAVATLLRECGRALAHVRLRLLIAYGRDI